MAKKPQHGGPRPGSGRPTLAPDQESILVGTKLPANMVAKLDAYATKHEVTRAHVVREAVSRFLNAK